MEPLDQRHAALVAAIAIMEQANQRTKAVKSAAARLKAELAALPVCWSNFHDKTAAIWEPVVDRNFSDSILPTRAPDFISRSGSQYWAFNGGVIRLSDHWGSGIRSCDWYLRGADLLTEEPQIKWSRPGVSGRLALAYCSFRNFRKMEDRSGVRGSMTFEQFAA